MGRSVWWAPRTVTWWIGVLFAIGSTCFLVGPFPGYLELVGSGIDGLTFFVGSIFFTTAATLQWSVSMRTPTGLRLLRWHDADWWSSGIQWIGTLLFNASTFNAMRAGLEAESYDRLVWRPDLVGSACFLVSGAIAYVAASAGSWRQRPATLGWWISAVNLLGCVAFGISAVASFWVPDEGSVSQLAAANLFTSLGGLCFLVGAILLLPTGRDPDVAENTSGRLPFPPARPPVSRGS